MKKYLVIGNPIEHSLSPKLHNYWIKKKDVAPINKTENIFSKNAQTLLVVNCLGKNSGEFFTGQFTKGF